MADFFGIVISIIAILFVGYCVLAIPYYYIKKIYLYLFKKSKKINQHKTLEKFEETPSENKLDQQIEVLKKKRKKVKEDHQIEYEKKYTDIGLKKPKPNKLSSQYYSYVYPIVSRIGQYDVEDTKKGKVEKTKVGNLLVRIVQHTKKPISDLKIAGLNGGAKRIEKLKINKNSKYFEPSLGYSKIIAKGYTIEFKLKAEDWGFKNKLKSYDDFFREKQRKEEEPPPWDYFVKTVITPIGLEIEKRYKNLVEKYCYDKLYKLRLSPPYGQKIRIYVYLTTTSKDLIYYNQNYITDVGKRNINKISIELDKIFKKGNVSLHHCYEDALFREQAIRLAENNFRKNNNIVLIGEGWTNQTDLFNKLKSNFNAIEKEYTPKWMSPKRIDIYIKKYKVAIEYHGYQHYFPLPFFGGEKAFKKRQIGDKLKEKICLKNKSSFIEWPYDVEINNKNISKVSKFIEKNQKNLYSTNVKKIFQKMIP
uniref:Uncharacterized protein n=1 Tax=uncultured Alphaproteobacteria bacterium TaxID=91750 RepID=A0A1B0Z2F3_9PROT|nr:hypothetical protein [uncultured Alphaproteobacteria bacterium]ANO58382.1 hypothetical protein [uncultured Alphaproteobacteria bacterium]